MRCPGCPVPAGQSCQGECPGLGGLCEKVAAGDQSAVNLVVFKAGMQCPACTPPKGVTVDPVTAPVPGVPAAPPSAPSTAPNPYRARADCIRLIRACPHRDTSVGNCQYAGCKIGKGLPPGKVFIRDCVACFEAEGAAWPPTAPPDPSAPASGWP